MTQVTDQHTQRLMDYFPVQMKVSGRKIIFCGGQDEVLAKVRLLIKTSADLLVFAPDFCEDLQRLSGHPRLRLVNRSPQDSDFAGAVLCYVGVEDDAELKQLKASAARQHVPVCVIDNKPECDFLTPAIIDHAPVTVAIGSEGYAPVLVRMLKALFEQQIPAQTGRLAVYASGLRAIARLVPGGHKRRAFWSRLFGQTGPAVLASSSDQMVPNRLKEEALKLAQDLINDADQPPHVDFISAGPGGAGLMTQRAAHRLRDADVILHDRLISPDCLELCRREADVIEVGKTGYASNRSANWTQQDIDQLLISSARTGKRVVRLKAGDAGLFGRLDEETEALSKAGISFEVIPGVTTASAMAAEMGVSLTKRGRNRELTLLTGHQLDGFAEHDWRRLATEGAVTAIYMGRHAATWIQGRLMMFGASPDMPVTVARNVGRAAADWHACTLSHLAEISRHLPDGPVLILLGLHPHPASAVARRAEQHDYKGLIHQELVL